ncbi:MAG: methylated-DNA--[protein]-cysteine S-methyltransferase [Pseudomonadota bacterium]
MKKTKKPIAELEHNSIDCTGNSEDSHLSQLRTDYDCVCQIISYAVAHSRVFSSNAALADAVSLKLGHLETHVKHWAGLNLTEFLKSLTPEYTRKMLHGSASLLHIAHELGDTGATSLDNLLIKQKSIKVTELRHFEPRLVVRFGFHETPFGVALIMVAQDRICSLGFCDNASEQDDLLQDIMTRWPDVSFEHDQIDTAPYIQQVFAQQDASSPKSLDILLIGTEFEIRVWKALLEVPVSRAVTYSDMAEHLGNPNAQRAVGTAVGRNPISFVVPCHRVLRKDASLGGYHWGLVRKQAMISWEAGRLRAEVEMIA